MPNYGMEPITTDETFKYTTLVGKIIKVTNFYLGQREPIYAIVLSEETDSIESTLSVYKITTNKNARLGFLKEEINFILKYGNYKSGVLSLPYEIIVMEDNVE